jgi:DNA polymerase I-like protein with 3'-5' exonuclease and polymerase domains
MLMMVMIGCAQESADEALARLIEVMQSPMPEGEELLVELAVDGNTGTTWYEAK